MYRYLKVAGVPLLYWRGRVGETEPRAPFYRGKKIAGKLDWKLLVADNVDDAAYEIQTLERSPERTHRPTVSRLTTCDEAFRSLLDFRTSDAAPQKLRIEPGTKDRWLSTWTNHCESLHKIPVAKLTEEDLTDVLDAMRANGYFRSKADRLRGKRTKYATSSLINVQTALDAFCEGMTWKRFGKLLTTNLAKSISPEERLEQDDVEPITQDKVVRDDEVAAIAANMGDPKRWDSRVRRTAVLLMVATGGRISEVLGLGLQQIDLARGQVHFERQLRKGFKPSEPLTWFGGLKGNKGKLNSKQRIVTLSTSDWEMIREYIVWGKQQGILSDFGLLFPTKKGTPIAQSSMWETWNAALAKAGITRSITSHYLRHTFASKCFLERGATVAQVSSWLGHSSEKITREVYLHIYDLDLLAEQERAIMDRNLRRAS